MSDEDDDDEYEDDDEEDEPAPAKPAAKPPTPVVPADLRAAITDRHLRFGWWGLFLFAGLGLVLESLNGLRVDYYINVANDTRRHMFTLAHAHGTLLSLVNLAFAFTVSTRFGEGIRNVKTPSACLLAALILLPAGFFTGGLVIYDGDPGLGIVMVPVGALLLIVAALLVVRR
jgi:hypothetical protein